MIRVEIKTAAKKVLKENLGTFVLISLGYGLIVFALNLIPILGGFLAFLIFPVYYYAVTRLTITTQKKKNVSFGTAFEGLKGEYFLVNVAIHVIYMALTMLLAFMTGFSVLGLLFTSFSWAWLLATIAFSFFIFWLQYSWFLIPYDSYDDPQFGKLTEYMRTSKDTMKGHKFELFVQHLSFLGWAILIGVIVSILTVFTGPFGIIIGGILYLILMLYIEIADVIYCRSLLGKDEYRSEIVETVKVEVVE